VIAGCGTNSKDGAWATRKRCESRGGTGTQPQAASGQMCGLRGPYGAVIEGARIRRTLQWVDMCAKGHRHAAHVMNGDSDD
jgi:hypothetical protein